MDTAMSQMDINVMVQSPDGSVSYADMEQLRAEISSGIREDIRMRRSY